AAPPLAFVRFRRSYSIENRCQTPISQRRAKLESDTDFQNPINSRQSVQKPRNVASVAREPVVDAIPLLPISITALARCPAPWIPRCTYSPIQPSSIEM